MSRTAVAVFALCVWVLAGPVAMAFGGCPMMASMCEAPCGMSACTFAPPIRVVAPYAVALLEGGSRPPVASAVIPVRELPPKFLHRSA